ncbi:MULTISPECIES: hypothetical protein [unclassified Mycolicibacterium]|uniref:hypothetical protein n=1 Tax=unclassified Mycolicibacterium TaxID=2636767 RepID=UPI002EDA6DD5
MILRRTAVGAALIAAPLAFAAPAMASPDTTVDCSPCVRGATSPATTGTGAPWTDFFANAPWEKVWPGGDAQGAWEKGVEAINGGAWEKVFPPAE